MTATRRTVLTFGASAAAVLALGRPGPALAESASPRKGGTLTFAAVGEPTTLAPLTDSNTRTRNISTKVLEGLVRFDRDFKPEPVLATAWSTTADGLRTTFTLRKGVKWHDGKEFTSADVRFSLLTFKRVGPRARITLASVVDVETPDPYTAVVVLSRPTPYLLKALTGGETPILAAHTYPTENVVESPNGVKPVGTGPFIVEEWRRGSHVVLKRNADYWGGEPLLDRVVVRFLGDSTAASNALETGEADLSFDVALYDLDRLRANPQLAVETYADGYLNNAQIFEFNLDNPVLANVAVRRALAHAIDRRFIVESVYYGTAQSAASTIPSVFKAYNDEEPFTYSFDPGKASRLLDEAGLKRGADGARFSLRLTFLPGDPFKKTSEYLRSAFAKVGVKVEILDGDLATFIRRVYTDRGFDVNLNGISRLFDPTAGVQRLYWSDGIRNVAPYVNAAHYNNPAVDDLFRAAAVEPDERKRAEQFRQIQAITGADLPNFALVALPTIVVRNKRALNLVTTVDIASSDFARAWLDR